ncbi:MAG: hypothetical protein AMJ61_00545 [Desulfobacterales bacterium SG8_35_2]|nr:MAG: hypothetical protein AMJ61_00545 [Desulfobacterales bacterium SG8_35_2]
MQKLHLGVANSISANFEYDPLDTAHFAKQEGFKSIQIYLRENWLEDHALLDKIKKIEPDFEFVLYHAEGFLNIDFPATGYFNQLYLLLNSISQKNYLIHFDENIEIDKLLLLVEKLKFNSIKIFVETYFNNTGKDEAEKNIKKYMALFTLTKTQEKNLLPALDIPRFFHKKLGFSVDEALGWCYQLFNFFGNKDIPILLHLIDSHDSSQKRATYCPIGEGYIPYQELFDFISKTNTPVSDIILEFEDKINPLKSRKYMEKFFKFD